MKEFADEKIKSCLIIGFIKVNITLLILILLSILYAVVGSN